MRPNRVSRWIVSPALLLVSFCAPAAAHHRTAPPGYYPEGYDGDVWVGIIVQADDVTGEITLRDVVKGKVETFVGVLEQGYLAKQKNGSIAPLKPSEIPPGMSLAVFYNPETKKVSGKKVHYSLIFNIDRIPNWKRRSLKFKVFAGGQ